jgi:proline iminopeptidase
VLFDQRGSGRSTPLGEIDANATDMLVQDLDTMRRHLGVERWMLFGGSWGAVLALRYAQAFPDAVSAMLLRGSFLGRPRDVDWFFGDNGAARIFPDAYSDFVGPVPVAERGDLVGAYHRRVHGTDPEVALVWAGHWRDWADRVATWTMPASATEVPPEPQRLLAKVRIETHYAAHRYFIADRPLLDAADRMPEVPISIVHGRRDLVCPCEAAWTLQRCIPGSRLMLLPDAGHLMSEPAMVDALVGETDRLKAVGRGLGSPN